MAPTDAERLLALLREPCCPICILARRAAREYLETRLLRLSTGASQGPKALYEQDPPMVSGAVLCSPPLAQAGSARGTAPRGAPVE
ncbi:hypothetical protein [Allomeiothermus silvanus]